MGNNRGRFTWFFAFLCFVVSFMVFFLGGGVSIPNKMSAYLKFIHYIYEKQI